MYVYFSTQFIYYSSKKYSGQILQRRLCILLTRNVSNLQELTLYTILSTEYDGVSSDIDTLNVIAGTTL